MTERFKKAYDSLVRAFFEGTLAKATCMACACGNIIYDAIGDPVTKKDLENLISWANKSDAQWEEAPEKHLKSGTIWASKRIAGLGEFRAHESCANMVNEASYTAAEFAAIETAFEANTKIHFSQYTERSEEAVLEDQYNGLCAVVDVLMKLDETKEGAEEYKQKFREHPKLQTC